MISNYEEDDYCRVVQEIGPTSFLPETGIEIIGENKKSIPPQHILFDFDGTLSLVREGWPEIMIPMMVEVLQATDTKESIDTLRQVVTRFVMQLNGKQTIYQMLRLVEEVCNRGGTPKEPLAYKQMYLDRLSERVGHRTIALHEGRIPPEDMLVPFSLELLDALQQRGVQLYLASGTDEPSVIEEAKLLGLDRYFGSHIYGAQNDRKAFSKAMVIQRILQENDVSGQSLLGFGDGYVEIQNVKAVGGVAVAVASDEVGRSGKPNAWKRDRLIGAGADLVIPDYRDYQALLHYLWNKTE